MCSISDSDYLVKFLTEELSMGDLDLNLNLKIEIESSENGFSIQMRTTTSPPVEKVETVKDPVIPAVSQVIYNSFSNQYINYQRERLKLIINSARELNEKKQVIGYPIYNQKTDVKRLQRTIPVSDIYICPQKGCKYKTRHKGHFCRHFDKHTKPIMCACGIGFNNQLEYLRHKH